MVGPRGECPEQKLHPSPQIRSRSVAFVTPSRPAFRSNRRWQLFEPLFAGTTLATVGAGAIIAYGIINLVHLTHGEQCIVDSDPRSGRVSSVIASSTGSPVQAVLSTATRFA